MEENFFTAINVFIAFCQWSGSATLVLLIALLALLRILWHHGKMHEIAKLHLLYSIPIEEKIGPRIEELYGEETPFGGRYTYLREYTKKNL